MAEKEKKRISVAAVAGLIGSKAEYECLFDKVVEELLQTKGQLYEARLQLEASRLALGHRTIAAPIQEESVGVRKVMSPIKGANDNKLPAASSEGKTGRNRKRRKKKVKAGGTPSTVVPPVQDMEVDFTVVKSKKKVKAKKPAPPAVKATEGKWICLTCSKGNGRRGHLY